VFHIATISGAAAPHPDLLPAKSGEKEKKASMAKVCYRDAIITEGNEAK